MDTPQWPQGIGVMEGGGAGARKARPQKDQALNCPRCNSTNTKFCYYNNYSLSQPRYFCKTCRRYWTEGGSLRNVPVGGGSRKNKRSIPSSAAATAPSSKIKLVPDDHDHHQQHHIPLSYPHLVSPQNPSKIQYQGQDLNLSYPPGADHQHQGQFISKFVVEMPQYMTDHHHDQNPSTTTTTTTTTTTPAMELFKSVGIASRGLISSFMSMPVSDPMYQNGLNHLQDQFKPSGGSALNFRLDGLENGGYGSGVQETNSARVLFPFEDSSRVQVSNTSDDHQGDSTGGYWSGMLGGEGGGGGGGGGGSW